MRFILTTGDVIGIALIVVATLGFAGIFVLFKIVSFIDWIKSIFRKEGTR